MTKQEQAKKELKELIERIGTDTIYVVQRHVSPSGMTRYLDLYVIGNNEPLRITYSVAEALGWTYNKRWDCLTVGGCGMDMHFHTVYTLSRVLYRDELGLGDAGYKLKHRTI